MKLLLIRHGIAVPRGTRGIPDDARPLTPRGQRRFRRAARGLARITAVPDVILTSPLRRAGSTARIAARAWGRISPTVEPALASGTVDEIFGTLRGRSRDATVVLVGHEPMLSAMLARLLGSAADERFAFRKGGAALVDVRDEPAAGGQLLWFLKPRLLRTLGR